MYFLGIDTSCYTTSCAIVDQTGRIIAEERKLLEVAQGKRGLAQSEMVFQHTRNLPELLEKMPRVQLAAIGVSSFPRREEGSYMPVFLTGEGMARSLSHMLHIPLYSFSHQENHVLAALRTVEKPWQGSFYSLHVSGGTTELLFCEPTEPLFHATLVAGSMDLNAGQFVDRVGVAIGLSFPAGPSMEALANRGQVEKPMKISLSKGNISFSGPCSEVMRRIEREQFRKENLACEVFDTIERGLTKLLLYHLDRKPAAHVIAVGGVMSNMKLRKSLRQKLQAKGIHFHVADASYSSDNATGNAYGASIMYTME